MPVSLYRSLIIPDTHIPFHDKRAYNLMLKAAVDYSPHEVVILGDYADFYNITSHQKDPRITTIFKAEVRAVNDHLDEIDELFPRAKKKYIQGNHEWRLERFLANKAPELHEIIDCPTLFNLDRRRGWDWIPYSPDQRYRLAEGRSKLSARHEPIGRNSGTTVYKGGTSVVYGHVHHIQETQIVMLDGQNHRAFCVGWLGNKKHPVFEYVKSHWQWSLGFGTVNTVMSTGEFFANTHHIIGYKCYLNGKLYQG